MMHCLHPSLARCRTLLMPLWTQTHILCHTNSPTHPPTTRLPPTYHPPTTHLPPTHPPTTRPPA
eukprot:358584-Chlamydomonas_euryale.AAC.3